jgi:hypothetical protein
MPRRDLTEEEIEAILDRAYDPDRPRPDKGPLAVRTWYDVDRGLVMVEFDNGCLLGFPLDSTPARDVPPERRPEVELMLCGEAVGWLKLGVGVHLMDLLARAFRARAWAGRYLGAATSEAKAEAARRNGLKGGRPRKKLKPQAADAAD